MGFGLPRVIVNEKDLSYYVDTLLKGVSCVAGPTERGPVGVPTLISSAHQYTRIFGGDIAASDFPMLAKRALSYGATLWVSRVVHHEDPARRGTETAAAAHVEIPARGTGAPALLRVKASSPGAWGDDLSVHFGAGGIDPDAGFTLRVYEGGEPVETWADLSMRPEDETFCEKIKSAYIEVEALAPDLSEGMEAAPALGIYELAGGDDGLDGLCDADFIGDAAAKTGLYAFDVVDDAIQLAVPGVSSPAVIAAGLGYCEGRGDLLFVTETPFGLTPQEAVDFRLGQGSYSHAPFVSSYGAMYYPKLKVYDTSRARERLISPVGDVLGVMCVNDFAENESFVPAGTRRGRILNALGVDQDVGGAGRLGEANYLCENQIDPVCVFPDTGPVVWGAQTLQRQASLLREVNVRRMLIVVKKTLAAYARAFIHQPNDPRTWREFYRGLDPKFREWKAARWFYDYRIFCDQDAKSLDDAKLNVPESVQRGEFKCEVFIKPVVGIKWILLDAVITRLDADFNESLTDVLGL